MYVCSPYRGDVIKNVEFAQECCKKIIKNNNIPIAPHLYFPQFMNDDVPSEREFAFELNKLLIDICDVVCVFGSEISEGMQIELDYAESTRKTVWKFGKKYKGGEMIE